MSVTALVCSVPVALFGAYYLVNAGAVGWLGGVEGQKANRVRVRLRRVNGVVMLLMSLALYLGISRVFEREPEQPVSPLAAFAWLAVPPLLVMMLVLAWIDVRLTRKLRRDMLRIASMKTNNQNPTTARRVRRCAGEGAACLGLCAALGAGALVGCDDSSAQPPASRPATGPATRQASTRPTTLRAQDDPRPGPDEPQRLRTVEMKLGEEMFVIQVADTDEERMAGLMFYKTLGPNEGMIFIYPQEDWLSFWMKNTFIPLDIAFLDEEGRVLNVEQMVPHDLEGTPSDGQAKYAIELPLGAARRAGLKAGQTVKIPQSAREAKD